MDEIVDLARLKEPPVRLGEVLALYPSLRIVPADLEGSGYFLDYGRFGAEIVVRSDDQEVRRRFTVAHELGHWCLRTWVDAHGEVQSSSKVIEEWCNRFAGALLMPREWLRRHLQVPLAVLPRRLLELHKTFLVSSEALLRRASEVGDITIVQYSEQEEALGRLMVPGGPKPRDRRVDSFSRELMRELLAWEVGSIKRSSDGRLSASARVVVPELGRRKWLVCIVMGADQK